MIAVATVTNIQLRVAEYGREGVEGSGFKLAVPSWLSSCDGLF
jgi:hypothetical protein